MVSLEFSIDIILPAALLALGLTQPLREMSNRNISWEVKGGRCVGLTTLPLSCADCLEIWEASTSWNPQSLSRPVMGLLYLLHTVYTLRAINLLKKKVSRSVHLSTDLVQRCTNPWRQNVGRWCLTILGPHLGTWFMWHSWRVEFSGGYSHFFIFGILLYFLSGKYIVWCTSGAN